jgi:hypothetical protein
LINNSNKSTGTRGTYALRHLPLASTFAFELKLLILIRTFASLASTFACELHSLAFVRTALALRLFTKEHLFFATATGPKLAWK